ncbi:MAG: helix-turn-helix domain-containing protein [Candidatus Ventricola sp.]
MIRKIAHYVDSLLTQDLARQTLPSARMVVAWYTNRENTCSVAHSHPYFELILPLAGEVLYSCNGSLYHIHPGELIIFPDEVYHMGRYDVSSEVSERLLLQVDQALWREVAARLGTPDFLISHGPVIFNADVVSAWDMRDLFLRIDRSSSMTSERRDQAFRAQLAELMLILQTCMSSADTVSADATSALVDKAQKYIQMHYTEPTFSINQLTDYLYVSRSHISRVFREYTMDSIHGYLTALRLQHFKSSLVEGRSVLDACTESGFSDYSSFLKTFRKVYGITPKEYRKRLMQNPDHAPVEAMSMLDVDALPAPIAPSP